jgi:hypothetical protein
MFLNRRVFHEAKKLWIKELWDIADISHALGFSESP